MGRPRKHGMDYFPHDTDAAGDEKIDAFRTIHGNDAYAFYFILCERIYRTSDAELEIGNKVILAALAKRIMVTIDRFNELLQTSLELGLFSRSEYDTRHVLTSKGIKQRVEQVDGLRAKWRRDKVSPQEEIVFHEENPSFPPVIRSQSKVKESKEKQSKANNKISTHNNDAPIQAPEPFAHDGNLDVWDALNHYRIKMNGFLNFEKIRAFKGVIADDLLIAAIQESGGHTDAYCLKVLESWNQKGWRKLEDHPKHRPTEGGDVIAIHRGRIESQRHNPRNATASAFEEAGRRSRPGKQVNAPRE